MRGIFGIDPAFDRATFPVNFFLLQSQAFAVGNRDLLRNNVNFGDRLRNRMFHLNASIHFEEVEGVPIDINQKFDGACAAIQEALCKLHRGFMNARAKIRGKSRCGSVFDQLLVAPLNRTVPFAQMNHSTFAVA